MHLAHHDLESVSIIIVIIMVITIIIVSIIINIMQGGLKERLLMFF